MKTVRIRDPGWKKVGSVIRDPGSATLVGRGLGWALEIETVLGPEMASSRLASVQYLGKKSLDYIT
jgi:hypothetical protein